MPAAAASFQRPFVPVTGRLVSMPRYGSMKMARAAPRRSATRRLKAPLGGLSMPSYGSSSGRCPAGLGRPRTFEALEGIAMAPAAFDILRAESFRTPFGIRS